MIIAITEIEIRTAATFSLVLLRAFRMTNSVIENSRSAIAKPKRTRARCAHVLGVSEGGPQDAQDAKAAAFRYTADKAIPASSRNHLMTVSTLVLMIFTYNASHNRRQKVAEGGTTDATF